MLSRKKSMVLALKIEGHKGAAIRQDRIIYYHETYLTGQCFSACK